MKKIWKKNNLSKIVVIILAISIFAINIFLVQAQTPSEIIVDNSDANFVGYWPSSTSKYGYYDSDYQYNWPGVGRDTATWWFDVPSAGVWEVFATWSSSKNRASDAKFTVNHAGGSTVVVENQEVDGGKWNSLGAFSFAVGSYSVILSDDANQYVIADAIRLVPVKLAIQHSLVAEVVGSGSVVKSPDLASYDSGSIVKLTAIPSSGYVFRGWSGAVSGDVNPATVMMDGDKSVTATFDVVSSEIIVDNSGASFVGYWPKSTLVPGYYGSNYQYNGAGVGSDTATWWFDVPSAGVWEVFARWSSRSTRASDAKFTVNHVGGSTVVVENQEVDGGKWNSLGAFSFAVGSYSVVLSDDANQYVIADAIRLVKTNDQTSDQGDDPVDPTPSINPINVKVNDVIGKNKLSLGVQFDWERWDYFVTRPVQQQLVQDANFKLIRVFDFRKTNPRIMPCSYWDQSTNTGSFDWTQVDAFTDAVYSVGAEPIFCLGWASYGTSTQNYIPPGMKLNPATNLPYPDSYAAYCVEWVKHFQQRGIPVRYYQIMNEPHAYFGWNIADTTKLGYYVTLWNTCARAMRSQNPDVLLSHDTITMKSVFNYWLTHGDDVDFFDFHKYDTGDFNLDDSKLFSLAETNRYETTSSFYGIDYVTQTWLTQRGELLPIINSESSLNYAANDGTDPRLQTMTGAVWTGLSLRKAILKGVSFNVYFEFSSSKSFELNNRASGGLGYGMVNLDDNVPYYPYYVNKLIGSNLAVGDNLVSTTSSVSGLTTLAWIHNGSPVLLVINRETSAKQFSVRGISGSLDVSFIDSSKSSVQFLSVEQNGIINLDGYTVMVIK